MTRKHTPPFSLRQGDVALIKVAFLPAGCMLVAGQEKKIILAWGEVTGHHHRIEDHMPNDAHAAARTATFEDAHPEAAAEITEAAIARAKARLWKAPNGDTYLEVFEPVSLLHEEHAGHTIQPGIYLQPTQVEYTPAELRRVQD